MKQLSKIVIALVTPLILLSGNGLILFQHHCSMEGFTSYSLSGLLELNTCCEPGMTHENQASDRTEVIQSPEESCCTSFTIFLKTSEFNDAGDFLRSNTDLPIFSDALLTETPVFSQIDRGDNLMAIRQPPAHSPTLPFLSIFRL